MTQRHPDEIKEFVRQRYGTRAREELAVRQVATTDASSCCGPSEGQVIDAGLLQNSYSRDELKDLPEDVLMSMGCGNPTAIAQLRPGESVLDLGSGGGLDVFLAAQKVGPRGRAVGLDMTPDMVELARRNAAKAGLRNVEFHLGEMESMPFEDNSFDVIISNCVINLSPDKDAVFRESYRVLKPGGRFRVSDLVWLRDPTEEERESLERWAGCVAGALTNGDYEGRLRAAGFADVAVRVVGEYRQEDVASAYIEGRKPAPGEAVSIEPPGAVAAPAGGGGVRQAGCC